ncbi:cation:proton antiporter [Gimesia maris]|uniref:cation:proton antiporter n=1 Tax=Gimesia maris TaxID=122 RepID=UPI00241EBB06|nr:sodium:proton antiporter [Gimesia maris]|tara:strand:- start:73273 stop:75093 length:1821 start_codon:yes stop_codon:yes gene_type:complete
MNEHAILSLSFILLAGMLCQWVAWRVKFPAIIFLLTAGIVAGPVTQWLNPDRLFGELLFPFVSLAVAVILFEGSLTLKIQNIPGLERVIRNLITIGAFITWMITALATRTLLDFSWSVSFLFGALMVVTGPTVIMPLLRTVRPKENVASILQWEGILIDPLGAILAVLVFEFLVSGGVEGGFTAGLLVFGKMILIGMILGAAGGFLFGFLLKKYWIPHYLHNISALALVCVVFAVSNVFEAESGLLSVTIMGIWLANSKGLDLDDILDFKESLSILLISMLFIILAARMNLDAFIELGWPALAVFAVIQFVIRPLSVHLCAVGSKLTMNERHLLSWIAPRGIVAAAISALFAIRLEYLGYQDASRMVPLTFIVIIGTVLLQSATAGPLARILKVAEPENKGFLIVGANAVAQIIAEELKKNGIHTLMTDQNWSSVTEAKLKGLAAYWGNPVSEHAERNLNLMGIGNLLAMSPQVELNALAAQYYRLEFAPSSIFTIRNAQPTAGTEETKAAFKYSGRVLFGDSVTFQDLEQMLHHGAEMKTTQLTEEFTYEDYLKQQGALRVSLFAIDANEVVHVFTAEPDFVPKAGWKIMALAVKQEAQTGTSPE